MKMALPVNCELSCRHWLGLLQSTVEVRMHNVSLLQPFSKSKPFPVFIKPINKGWQRKIIFLSWTYTLLNDEPDTFYYLLISYSAIS